MNSPEKITRLNKDEHKAPENLHKNHRIREKRTDSGKEAAGDESREWEQAHQAQRNTI